MNQHTPSHTAQVNNFSKEQVKRRLRAQAVSLWGLQDTDADNLDPVIDLLMSACAVELERTAHQAYASQARVLERLAELMVPEVTTNARPAHAIMHACSDLPIHILKKDDLFSVDKEVLEGSKTNVTPITFSPASDVKLFDASIVCQATKSKITFYESPLTKGDIYYATSDDLSTSSSIWLGLKLNKDIKNLTDLSFFFDWKNQPDKSKFIPLLATTEWRSESGNSLRIDNTRVYDDLHQITDSESMKSTEDHVTYLYQKQFCTVREKDTPIKFSKYPAALSILYTEEVLSNLKEELFWVEVKFSEGIALQATNDLYCAVNCFPVINRKLHTGNRPYALSSNLNIIPLTTNEHFIAVNKVFSASRHYYAVTLDKLRELEEGSYTVKQSGVNRFDQRDAETLLHYLYELMRDECAAFKASGNYALNTEIKELEQSLSRLKLHFINKSSNQTSKCHLFLQSKYAEDVWVEFWTSQGEEGNAIPAGTKVKPLSPSNVKRTSLLMITSTSGGREPLNDVEKVHAYRFALLTRSRIATEEDLKAACFAEFGEKIINVEIKKGFRKDLVTNSGFVKTIDIILTPSSHFQEIDWNTSCKELESYIEKNKLFLTSIQVLTSKDMANATV